MQIILLESFDKLGKIGDIVEVKDGFARNFLLPKKKALRANKSNKEYFEKIKKDLEESNKKLVSDADSLSKNLSGKEIVFIRQASETGQLYGSVSPKDISNHFKNEKISIPPSNINLTTPIKKIGIFEIKIKLHAEVSFFIKLNVAISSESAEEQKLNLEKSQNDSLVKSKKIEKKDEEVLDKKEKKEASDQQTKDKNPKKIKLSKNEEDSPIEKKITEVQKTKQKEKKP